MKWAAALTLIVVMGVTLSISSIVTTYAQNQSLLTTNETATTNTTGTYNTTSSVAEDSSDSADDEAGEISGKKMRRR